MKRGLICLLTVMLMLSLGITVFAADGEIASKEIDVQAKYTRLEHDVPPVDLEDASGTATMEDGAIIHVSDAPENAVSLVIYAIPKDEKEIWAWFNECLKNAGVLVQPYDIYFLDNNGNRLNADGAKISIERNGSSKNLSVYGVTTDGTAAELESSFANGVIVFITNGSHYYVLAEQSDESSSTEPSEPEDKPENKPEDGGDSPQTGDESNLQLWSVLLLISTVMLLLLFAANHRRKHTDK